MLKTPWDISAGSQIIFFMYGVPVLLALCTLVDGPWRTLFVWMDGIQVCIMGFLTYVVIFDVIPLTGQQAHPVPIAVMVLAFNIENLVLATAALLRYVGAEPETEQRRFYGGLSLFLIVYALCAAKYNSIASNTGYMDLLVDLPFFLFVLLVHRDADPRAARGLYLRPLAMLLDNGTPTLFPATVVALGMMVARSHYNSAVCSIAVALSIYGVRSTLVQAAYQRAQARAKDSRDSMEILSLTDALTGIPNRRHFDKTIQAEWNRASRQESPLSLLMVDIDHFKFINDTFGHADGDICIRQVASALKASLQREFDTLTRYGGEEFAAILPQTDRAGAEIVAQRMRGIVNNLRLRNRAPYGSTVTVSIGIATREAVASGAPEDLVETADRALYRAKRAGRDRAEFEPMASAILVKPVEALAS